jgi:hypothetical protein
MKLDLPCPECSNVNLITNESTKESTIVMSGTMFPEGMAASGKREDMIAVVRCLSCNFVGMLIEKRMSYLIAADHLKK